MFPSTVTAIAQLPCGSDDHLLATVWRCLLVMRLALQAYTLGVVASGALQHKLRPLRKQGGFMKCTMGLCVSLYCRGYGVCGWLVALVAAAPQAKARVPLLPLRSLAPVYVLAKATPPLPSACGFLLGRRAKHHAFQRLDPHPVPPQMARRPSNFSGMRLPRAPIPCSNFNSIPAGTSTIATITLGK